MADNTVCDVLPWRSDGSGFSIVPVIALVIAEGVRLGTLLPQYAAVELLHPPAELLQQRRGQGGMRARGMGRDANCPRLLGHARLQPQHYLTVHRAGVSLQVRFLSSVDLNSISI